MELSSESLKLGVKNPMNISYGHFRARFSRLQFLCLVRVQSVSDGKENPPLG